MREIFSTRTGPQASVPDSPGGTVGCNPARDRPRLLWVLSVLWEQAPATAGEPARQEPRRSRLEIFRSDASVFSTAGNRSQIDALFPCQAADRRAGGNGSGAVEHGRRFGAAAGRAGLRLGAFWRRVPPGRTQAAAGSAVSPLAMVRMAWPTFTVSPFFTSSLATRPAWGQGISTTALSVSNSTTPSLAAITSPSWTSTLTTSPLWTFSPSSGSLKSMFIVWKLLLALGGGRPWRQAPWRPRQARSAAASAPSSSSLAFFFFFFTASLYTRTFGRPIGAVAFLPALGVLESLDSLVAGQHAPRTGHARSHSKTYVHRHGRRCS